MSRLFDARIEGAFIINEQTGDRALIKSDDNPDFAVSDALVRLVAKRYGRGGAPMTWNITGPDRAIVTICGPNGSVWGEVLVSG